MASLRNALISLSLLNALASSAFAAPTAAAPANDAPVEVSPNPTNTSSFFVTPRDVDVFIVAPLPIGYPITMTAHFLNDNLKTAQAEGKLSFGWRFDGETEVGNGCWTPDFEGEIDTSCSLPLVQRFWMTPGFKNVVLSVVDNTKNCTILEIPRLVKIVPELEPQNVVREEIHTFINNTQRWPQFYTSLQTIKDNGVYDNFVAIHLAAANYWLPNSNLSASAAHVGPAFLPWHRVYLVHYERALQVAANDFTLGIPYWDWTIDQAGGPDSLLTIFNGQGLGTPTQRRVRKPIPGTPHFYNGLEAGDVPDGPFCTLPATECANNRTWPVHPDLDGPTLQRNITLDNVRIWLPKAEDSASMMQIQSYDTPPFVGVYSNQVVDITKSFRIVLEGFTRPLGWTTPTNFVYFHNIVHAFIGGAMVPFTSPNDPVFFMHHANVDRLWELWETQVCAPQKINAGEALGYGSDWCYKPSKPSDVPPTVPGAVCNDEGCTIAGQMIDSEMFPSRVRVQQVLGPKPAYRWARSTGFN